MSGVREELLPCPFCGSPGKDAVADSVICTNRECDANQYLVGKECWQSRALGSALSERAETRRPDGYAYRYPDGYIRHGSGREINGEMPSEVIPYYYASTPAKSAAKKPVRETFQDCGCAWSAHDDNACPKTSITTPLADGAAWYVHADTEAWVTDDRAEAERHLAQGCDVRALVFGDVESKPAADNMRADYWIAVDNDGVVEFGYSADDANHGNVARQEVNGWINDQHAPGEYRLVGVCTAPTAPALVVTPEMVAKAANTIRNHGGSCSTDGMRAALVRVLTPTTQQEEP